MLKIEGLKQTADEMLGGLKADQRMYHNILRGKQTAKKPLWTVRRLAAVACALVLVAVSGGLLLNRGHTGTINTHTAGNPQVAPVLRAFAVPRGSITLSEGGKSAQNGIWARGKGGNFPLIAENGRYYRLLTNPTAVDESMLGASLGSVAVFTEEPALENAEGSIISNTVEAGTEVYQVDGMQNAAVAATVNGELRVFQRVSFSGNGIKGRESLTDTLGGARVVAMQLSDAGTVNDAGKIDQLMSLLGDATYKSGAGKGGGQTLLIQFDNHLVLQLSVKGDQVTGCGTWKCPGFADAFAACLQ